MTREEKLAAARARLAELSGKFLDRTRGDIATMRAGVARIQSGDAAPLEEIRHLAHRMAGTGATLGFDSLSQHAQTIEQLLDRCDRGVLPDGLLQARLSEAIEALTADFARQCAAPGASASS